MVETASERIHLVGLYLSKYIGDQHPLQVEVTRPKGTWKWLIGIRKMAEAHISWSLGPGMVDFWLDTLCELGSLRTLVPADRDSPQFLVAEFLGWEGWNRDRFLQCLPDHLVDSIVDIPFDLEGQDRIMWARGVPLKMSIFAWRLLRNCVPLDSVLRRRGLPLVSRCSCCLKDEESILHLFVNGPVAREGRNKVRFEGQALSARRVIREVVNFIHDLGRAWKLEKAQFYRDLDSDWASLASSVARKRQAVVVTWTKPPAQRYKLNTDASVVNERASGGGLLRDSDGRLIFAFYKEFGEKGVLQAEALALLEGLRACAAKGVQEVLMEVDSAVLVPLVKSLALGGWSHCNLLRRIRRLLDQVSVSFIHIFREANMVVDRLAALQGCPSMVFDSVQQLSREICGCLAMDAREFPSLRLVPC
nr:uncharacterized protein LOC113737473 [Coffea arabica]